MTLTKKSAGSGSGGVADDKYIRSTRFASISADSGTVTLPTSATVILDDFGGTVDAVITKIDGGKPVNESVYTAAGALVTTSFDASGNYTLSGTPSATPVAIIYRVRQTLANFDDTASDIIGEYDKENITAPASVTDGQLALWDGTTGTKLKVGTLTGTTNQITVTGTTLSTPQNIHTGASPEFVGIALTGNLTVATTSSTAGQIKLGTKRFIHSYGTGNLFIGPDSGNFTLTGTNLVGIGTATLQSITTAGGNIAIGGSALSSCTTGSGNTAIGNGCLAFVTDGYSNTAIGYYAGVSATASTSMNVFVGTGAGEHTTSNTNCFVGFHAGIENTSGIGNHAFGYSALASNTTAHNNTAFGYECLTRSTSAENVAFGQRALAYLTSGSKQTAVGFYAGYNQTTVSQSVFLGYQAGYYETAANKLFIDNQKRTNEADGRVKALIYGIFDADPANQKVYVNGDLYCKDQKLVAYGGGSTGAGTTPNGTVTLVINGTSYYLLTSASA